MRIGRALVAAALCLSLQVRSVAAQTGDNILLVTNSLSQASDEVAEYYARKRSVPNDQVLRLPLPTADEIDRSVFESRIQAPIAEWLMSRGAQDRILYIVVTKDVPLRIAGTAGQNGTVSSVDSELTLLYRRMLGIPVPPQGLVKNPYFLPDLPHATAVHFTHRTFDIYLVGRLDGYTVADTKAMIDRAAAPTREGIVVLDGKLELGISVGNRWLQNAAAGLRQLPGWSDRVVLDIGQTTLADQENVLGFYTWGSNAVAATKRRFGHQFVPGAIAAEFVSTDARTFKEPPADWVINDTKRPFAGSHQSLVGDFIRDGITGTAGHVAEPYLNSTIRPDALFPSYANGFNLIESFYMAMPSLSWQTVVIGDPLCAPFATRRPSLTGDLNPPLYRDTELPEMFATRRLTLLAATGARPEVAEWMAKAEVRAAKKDPAGVRLAFEQATTLDAEYVPANLSLAIIYERAAEWDRAIERYQRVIARAPNQATALNNLAYLLAVRKNNLQDAFPLASRAYAVSVQDPTIGDTLAWVYHLMGNDKAAEPLITVAARRLPQVGEVQLHAAIVLAATGNLTAAASYLENALKLDSTLADRADIKELQLKIKPAK